MRKNLSTRQIEKYSRQIVLKNVGTIGQKKILNSNVLVVGAGGLGCPIVDYLTRAGVGKIGVVDYDREQKVLDRILQHTKAKYSKDSIVRIWREIFQASTKLQEKDRSIIDTKRSINLIKSFCKGCVFSWYFSKVKSLCLHTARCPQCFPEQL